MGNWNGRRKVGGGVGDRSEGSISFSEPSLPLSSGTKTEGTEDSGNEIAER